MHINIRECKGIPTMQISRHWRIKPQRYRLEGVRYQNGDTSLQNRPVRSIEDARKTELDDTQESIIIHQAVATR
jgi:hypothetical protein